MTVCIDADVTYELDVTYFDPGQPGHWGHDDGSGAEIAFGNIVRVWQEPAVSDVTTFDSFLLNYAVFHECPLGEAVRRIEDEAIEIMTEQMRALRYGDY